MAAGSAMLGISRKQSVQSASSAGSSGGRLTSLTAPVTGAVAYTYAAAGNISRITYPDVTKFVDYAYDDAGRLDTVTDSLSQVTDYTYDDAGRLTQTSLPNGVDTDYTYDDGDRLLTVTNGNPTTFSSFTYTLDPGGNRTQVVDNAGTTTFTLDRLTQVTYPGPVTDTYTYDAIGNRLTRNAVASTYDDADQLLTLGGVTYGTYDANGNLITRGSDSFDYDHENLLTGTTIGGVTASNVYNGDGLRVRGAILRHEPCGLGRRWRTLCHSHRTRWRAVPPPEETSCGGEPSDGHWSARAAAASAVSSAGLQEPGQKARSKS